MVSALSRRHLHCWLNEAAGRKLLDLELELVDRSLADLFGYHIVQVGRLGTADLLGQSRILHQLVVELEGDPLLSPPVSEVGAGRRTVIRAAATDLPIESDSVDVLLLPHLLDFEADAHAALREGMRVVMPEGHVVISGFNPWSWFGLWRKAQRGPWQRPLEGNLVSPNRLKDWLGVLGFDLVGLRGCFFGPPVGNERVLRALGRMRLELLCRHALLAGSYVAVARKRVTRLTPIRARWRPRRRLAAVGLARPTARGGMTRDS